MKIKILMHEKYDEITAFISGLIGGVATIHIMDITWNDVWNNAGQLIWVGFVALFTGGMGVLGKHLVTLLIKRYKTKKQKQ